MLAKCANNYRLEIASLLGFDVNVPRVRDMIDDFVELLLYSRILKIGGIFQPYWGIRQAQFYIHS